MNTEKITLGELLGESLEDDFAHFDMTQIQGVLSTLNNTDAIDLAHAEMLQQQSLRGADIVSEFLGKLIKTVSFLETKLNSAKNRVALNYKAPDGQRTTADMKKQAGESSPEVEDLSYRLAKAKGSKSVLEKKYDILIRSHHHYKDLSSGMKKSITGFNGGGTINNTTQERKLTGWE
jgi:hypothetical protein